MMPFADLFSAAALATGLFGGLVLLAVGLLLGLREMARRIGEVRADMSSAAATAATERATDMAAVRAGLDQLASRIAAQRDEGLGSVAADLAAIRAEVEWLGGERMIEEAVRMCREGISVRRVGEELGISAESMRVISLLRTH